MPVKQIPDLSPCHVHVCKNGASCAINIITAFQDLLCWPVKQVRQIKITTIKWALTRENLSSGVCEQHRRRPSYASAQSDQRLVIRFS